MDISIIIIHYKSERYILQCLHSISYAGTYEIIVVDNQKDPRLMETIAKQEHTKILPYQGNEGFGAANNRGIKVAKGEYILTVNADCFLTQTYITRCIDFLKKHPRYGSVQGKLLLSNTPHHIDSTGHILSTTGFAYNENHQEPDWHTPSKDIFGVCAAAAVYRKAALNTVSPDGQYFDADFFAYLEDVDLDWRLQLAGWNAHFKNTAIAHHVRGATTNNKYRFSQSLRNRLFLVLKNDTPFRAYGNLLIYWPIYLLLPNRINNIKIIIRMIKKRKLTIRKRNAKEIRKLMKKTPLKKWINIRKLLKFALQKH